MIRDTKGDRVFSIVNGALLTLLTLLIAYPLYFVVIASVSNYIEINSGNVILLPAGLTFDSYRYVLEYKDIWNGYKNTIIITLLGTSINLLFTFTGAYALSKSRLPGMRACMLLITFTMFFGGGLIPTYMLVSDLGMRNTFWAMILPGAVSAYNLVLVRNYYQKNIPEELLQAAMIDGCDDMRVFRSIVLRAVRRPASAARRADAHGRRQPRSAAGREGARDLLGDPRRRRVCARRVSA